MAVTEVTGTLSKGTTLSYNSGESGSPSWTELGGIKTIPAMGSDPEKVDVTTLGDETRKYIKGLQDADTLEIAFVDKKKNFSDVLTLCQANKEYQFKVTYPDTSTAEFTGQPTIKRDSLEVNGAMGFSVSIVCSVAPHFTAATA